MIVELDELPRVLEGLIRKLGRELTVPDRAPARDRLLLDLMGLAWSEGVFATDVDFRRWLNAIHVPSKFSSYA